MTKWILKSTKLATVLVALAANPLVATADLVMSSGEVQSSTLVADDPNGITTFLAPTADISSFPGSGLLSSPYAPNTYSATQVGGVAHINSSFLINIPPITPVPYFTNVRGTSLVDFTFTPTVNEQFTLATSYRESGTSDASYISVQMYDSNGGTLVFDESRRSPTLSEVHDIPVYTGVLLAGQSYSFFLVANLDNYIHDNHGAGLYSGSATGEFDFTAVPLSAVPEPSTLALLGLGGIGTAINAYRRRRAAD